ncbi:MAG: hypothetical protein NT045_09305, partial [Candidatus Aureabacteria bacterium]|nr:hypothetical protein [Candidatus Auribacterota bacterium]
MNQLQQDIARLLAIQGQECRLLALEDDKERIPRMLEETRARIMRAEESLKAARGELKGIQVKKKELDLESESKLEAVAKYQKQQFDVKTNAEYQALEREIAERKVENARIEDRILEVMEAVEERERLVKAGDEAVKR